MFSSKLTHKCIFCHVTLHQATSDITGGCRGNVTPPTPHVESQGKVPGDVTHSVHYLGSNLHRTKLLTLFPQWIFLRLLLGKIFLVHLVPNVVVGLCVRTGVCSVFLTYLCSSVEHVHCPAAACSSSPWMIIYDKRRSLDFLYSSRAHHVTDHRSFPEPGFGTAAESESWLVFLHEPQNCCRRRTCPLCTSACGITAAL